MKPEDVLTDRDKEVQKIYEEIITGKKSRFTKTPEKTKIVIKKHFGNAMMEWEKIKKLDNVMFEFLFVRNVEDKSPEMTKLRKLWKEHNSTWIKINDAAEKYKKSLDK